MGGHDPSDCQLFNITEAGGMGQLPSFTPFQTLMVRPRLLPSKAWPKTEV